MQLEASFRAASEGDCHQIAQLYRIASDGVTDYVWHTLKADYPGLAPLEIGARRYADEQNIFGYKNCIVAEHHNQVIGMMVTFPTANEDTAKKEQPESEPQHSPTSQETTPEPDVLAPYNLEAPGTWYICALGVFPEYRGQGLGTQFLAIAHQQARTKGFKELSLLCFEQNTGAFRLYQRNGFKVVDRTPVVPHELIHYTGDVLLMTVPVS